MLVMRPSMWRDPPADLEIAIRLVPDEELAESAAPAMPADEATSERLEDVRTTIDGDDGLQPSQLPTRNDGIERDDRPGAFR